MKTYVEIQHIYTHEVVERIDVTGQSARQIDDAIEQAMPDRVLFRSDIVAVME